MFSTTSLVTVSTAQTPPYHCTSLQRLQSGHSCVDQWDWCYNQAEMTQFHCKLSCQTKWGQIHYQKIHIHFSVPRDLKKRYKMDIFCENGLFSLFYNVLLTTSIESQLSTDHCSIKFIPEIITHSAICIVIADFHSSLCLVIAW